MPIIIADIMRTRVVTVEMDDRLTVAKEIFEQANFHHLLVVDEYKLEGVLSERDLLRAISPNLGSSAETWKDLETLQKRVHQVMTRNPVTVAPHVSLDVASRTLLEHNIGCLPVLENGDLVGIVTWKDLLRAYCEHNEVNESEC
ncbi:CBS domain-containing protein [Shewanella xiamenensis]|uniref:CBS domain-containing protein n=1 Tax=Shewanella xiamenensis TaxID=332186 RepID=UPI000DB2F62F|nr:CBS domain-containing protein [Shewanella xiamenensis]MCT8863179.1 CBS domain-containing protein [Shewanella xiamenensis]MCT8875774.1 CBS domain-containing protein [Shewanella xiamenensis]PZP37271.1 MAG: CBS domain-containing protein [Shewanella oneidensis]